MSIKIKLPGSLIKFAYRFFDVEASGESAPPDSRVIEYPFILEKLHSITKGKVLDVGCVARLNYLPASLAALGWEVYGIDAREWNFRYPNFHFIQGNICHSNFSDNFFDCVYAVSTIGNIGLGGRYGISRDDSEGDVKAINEIFRILRPGGKMLATFPYGQEYRVVKPWRREYNNQRLKAVFNGWKIQSESFFLKDEDDCWVQRDADIKQGIALIEVSK